MEKIPLRTVITHRNKTVIFMIMGGVFAALYFLSGAISYQNGVVLPIPEFEANIPFWTWTIWIYIILYPCYIVWALYSYKNITYMNKTFYSFFTLTALSCIIFVIFPVIYPREFFPLPFNDDLSTLLFKIMRQTDKPSNCLPSLHVGICFCMAYGFRHESKKKFIFSLLMSTLISLSTLTTKQHYIYDIVAGFAAASLIHWFYCKFTFNYSKGELPPDTPKN